MGSWDLVRGALDCVLATEMLHPAGGWTPQLHFLSSAPSPTGWCPGRPLSMLAILDCVGLVTDQWFRCSPLFCKTLLKPGPMRALEQWSWKRLWAGQASELLEPVPALAVWSRCPAPVDRVLWNQSAPKWQIEVLDEKSTLGLSNSLYISLREGANVNGSILTSTPPSPALAPEPSMLDLVWSAREDGWTLLGEPFCNGSLSAMEFLW
jgi:hypothetical protein